MSHIPESAMPHAKAPHPEPETTADRVKKAASAAVKSATKTAKSAIKSVTKTAKSASKTVSKSAQSATAAVKANPGKSAAVAGAVVAGAGAYVYGLARSNIADYEKAVETKCPCASDADLGADADLPDRARTKEIAAYSMFALGGVTIATGIVLVVRGRSHTSVAPSVTNDSAGISFSGSW